VVNKTTATRQAAKNGNVRARRRLGSKIDEFGIMKSAGLWLVSIHKWHFAAHIGVLAILK
jgi:hypothetical protein